MWLTNSSIGRKFVMALTGAFLVLFVTFHCLMNAVAIFWPAAYNVVCAFLGANWYALVGTLILAAGFILHICYALWLTIENRKARGNDRYKVTSRPPQVEWASKNMLVLGIVILAFLVVHLIQFWARMQLQEVCGTTFMADGTPVPPQAGTWFLQLAFAEWYTLPVYIIGFIALWFHMNHGFWSMCQSSGLNGKTWLPRLKTIGCWWSTIVIALFIAEGVVFTIQANNEAYTNCDDLKTQYIEMAAEHQGATVNCAKANCAEVNCTKADCAKANCAIVNCAEANCTEANCAEANCAEANCAQCESIKN